MANGKLTISEILAIKGGSLEEFCQYALGKGITLPNDPGYALSPSELNVIAPTISYKLKFSKSLSNAGSKKPTVTYEESPAEDDAKGIDTHKHESDNLSKPQLNIIGKIDLNAISKKKANKIDNIKPTKRIIGIVKFYDRRNGWGFIISNSYGISDHPQNKERLYSLYINEAEWKSSYTPEDREWVVLTPQKNDRGKWNAFNVERLEYNRANLLLAMDYRGQSAKIKGKDKKGDEFDEDILYHILYKIATKPASYRNRVFDETKYYEVIDSFCEYLSRYSEKGQKSIIEEFVIDEKLYEALIQLILNSDYNSDDSGKLQSYNLLRGGLLDKLFSEGTINGLSQIPETFDLVPYLSQIVTILKKESFSDLNKVKNWLKTHPVYDSIQLDESDVDTIPLRLGLYEITEDVNWLSSLAAEWSYLKAFLKQNETQAYKIASLYFRDKDEKFIKDHDIKDLLDDSTLKEWCASLMKEPNDCKALLRDLMEYKVVGNLDLWEKYVATGVELSSSYDIICKGLSSEIKENAEGVRSFLQVCIARGIKITELFSSTDELSDELYAELFEETGDFEYLNRMEDFDSISSWVSNQTDKFIASFIKQYGPLIEDNIENDTFIKSLGDDAVVKALKTLSEEEKFQILRFFPKEFATDIVSGYFSDTKLFDLFIGEQWAKLKGKLPYMVFDLEADGDNIKEFAFLSSGYTHYYEDKEQLSSLVDEINSKPIVVGHRIKQWDLKILESHAKLKPAFIWDTLEIEILLNPCRYAYSLHTAHNAKDDTELTDRLFWNQLFRLAMNEELCSQLSDFLPKNINSIIKELRKPNFFNFFKKSGGSEDSFYQNLHDIDETLINQLKAINDEEPGSTLIVAPQRLWNRIAEHVNVSFIREDNGIDFLTLSENRIKESPLSDSFLQTVLLRFCKESKTPIVSNLASYLRIQYFRDNALMQYVSDIPAHIQCADLRYLNNLSGTFPYTHVYLIGCELENRLNQYTLPNPLRPSDFWQDNSSIPMRLGGSSYTYVTKEERALPLFNDVPSDASNVWIERTKNGKFLINYNFNVHQKLQSIDASLGGSVSVKRIKWIDEDGNNRMISLVRSGKPKHFDYTQKRVNSTTRYRSSYWIYQLALLNSVHKSDCGLPIIYILEDGLEQKQVEEYARTLGFFIPSEGTLITKLEKIAQRSDGLLVISKDRFFEVTEKRLYNAYCFVWDQMAVEKHMMMWNNWEESIGDSTLNDEITEMGADLELGSSNDTYQSALLSIWPVYQYYSRFISANNASSRMYILDSFLEDYHGLSSVWNTCSYACGELWNSEEDFNQSLTEAQSIFGEISTEDSTIDNDSIKNAMDVILATLVPDKDGKREWSDVQKKVLPEILSKKENYLVSIPTGGGKSVLFQGPALYNAAYTNHLSLVVTPLKALMQDQVRELAEKGFYTNVDFLNGDRTILETRSIYRKICSGDLALLYITPERFRSRAFLNALMTRMMNDHGLEYMIFDEAHCISQWGMEFRPEYLNVIKKCKEFSETFTEGFCIAMFSATVTDMIYNQINETVPVKRLGQENDKKIYNPIRSHIGTSFQLVGHDMDSRMKAIVSYVQENNVNFEKSRMLIFCKTRSQCEELAASLPTLLVKGGILSENDASERVGYFHAGLDAEDRDDAYNSFKSKEDPIYILCATKAFGMGMDIPNIHYIVHLSPPSVLEDYLQEVGRAGRKEEMYIDAGFSPENPIPTVCLYSTEDIKRSREQLLQSMLSWKNLEEIRQSVLNCILDIQSLEKTRETPVVIPNTLWASSPYDFDHTDFRLGEYWLERMGRIKMGYLSPAHITVTILERNSETSSLLSSKEGATTKRVHKILVDIANEKQSDTIQVSLQKIAGELSMHSSKVLNELIYCAKYKLISLRQDVRCRIARTRLDEVPYLLKNTSVNLAFQIIINAAERILQDNTLNIEKTYFDKEIREFMDMSSIDHVLKKVNRTTEAGTTEVRYYMPWYKEEDKGKNKGLSIAKNYKKDLMGKRFRQIFTTLLDIIPDVRCKSYIDIESKAVKQSILIEKNTWKDFLPGFKFDCLRTLQYIYNLQKDNSQSLNWAEAIANLKLEGKGFNYFDSILRYLSGMAYIASDNLLPTGIEVCTTDISEQPILEETVSGNRDYEDKMAFEEAMQIRNLRLCVMDVLTTKIHSSEEFQELISAYFSKTDANGFTELLSKYYEDHDPIWDAIRETAIKNAEEKMKDNPEQWAIYNENSNINVNVEAGPGSGKTHVLTMRCAKLIYRQHVLPGQILVLAYNRAVVVELKSRLSKLFTSLGLSRSASQLHVYTFHGLAKRICGDKALEGLEMKEWENELLELMRNNPIEVTKILGDIKYVLIDEFQDITQTRLEAMFELDKIYNNPAFFTIGDRDQSIYGFEKKESMDPEYYYSQLYSKLKPKRMTMSTNYRSYPKILKEASRFLPSDSKLPVACRKNTEDEPKQDYTFVYNKQRNWVDDFPNTISYLKKIKMNDVAVFFRTNNEVYHGYSLIRAMNIPDVRIRIQGASECELFRKREIYAVVHMLEKEGNKQLLLDNDGTKNWIKKKITDWIVKLKNWDGFYLDFAYTLVLDYLDFAEGDDERHTYAEMAESIKLSLAEDNPQLYKLYDKYQQERILRDKQMNVVLTTMHKVKGLEFDAVVVTPSVSSLPFDPAQDIDMSFPITDYDKDCIAEEQRLLYVAFTRAKKFLMAYWGERENAVLNIKKYEGKDSSLGIREKHPGLDNYNIGYNAGIYGFRNNKDIVNKVEKNAPVIIQRRVVGDYTFYDVKCNSMTVGQLSRSSSIRQAMEINNIAQLSGFFVSDVYYWTYQDSVLADQRNLRINGYSTDYASNWCDEAKQQGFIFIVSISGYGN